ncbi:MAG: hypothetical protein AAFN18_00860 [Cyanobacteria bacterium J06554_6]
MSIFFDLETREITWEGRWCTQTFLDALPRVLADLREVDRASIDTEDAHRIEWNLSQGSPVVSLWTV